MMDIEQALAEIERLRAEKDMTFRRYARAMKERDVAREQANKLFLALRNLKQFVGVLQRLTRKIQIQRDDDPTSNLDQAMVQAQAAVVEAAIAGVMAWDGDAGEVGQG